MAFKNHRNHQHDHHSHQRSCTHHQTQHGQNRHYSHHHNHQHHHHHHHRRSRHITNQSEQPNNADDMIRSKLDYYYKSQMSTGSQQARNDGQESGSGSGVTSSAAIKELCHPSCWCNNLVEITCRYPTKVIKYVSLIENNPSSMHSINRSLFENSIKLNVLQNQQANLSTPLVSGASSNMPVTFNDDDDSESEPENKNLLTGKFLAIINSKNSLT
jgi:hypothetical protein